MNKISILLLVTLSAAVLSERCCETEPCESPCDDCGSPHIKNHYWTGRVEQEINDETVLTCTPDSYFSSVVFKGCYTINTTCFSFEKLKDNSAEIIYTGITKSDERKIDLKARPYETTTSSNNGNWQRHENAPLVDCECKGDLLVSLVDYISQNPVDGCCTDDVNVNPVSLQTATSYELKIFGKCCSTCSLHKSRIIYDRPINNDGE